MCEAEEVFIHALVGMVVTGWWLNFMILMVFSNLNDSMILIQSWAWGRLNLISRSLTDSLCYFKQRILSFNARVLSLCEKAKITAMLLAIL